jgi:lipoate-protein ligase A
VSNETWLLLNSGPGPADFNMAFDEALLESAPARDRPLLRFYGWIEAAASFGYSQRFAEVSRMTALRPLIRRPTAGGLVLHDADWTYTLVFPAGHWWHAFRARESYRTLHEWIGAAFTRLKVPTELSPVRRQESPGRCFAGAEQDDVLRAGRKLAGAAQRRNRQGLLIQGSVRPDPLDLATADWQKALCDAAVDRWGVRWSPFEPGTDLNQRAEALARGKYSLGDYNEGR